MTKDFITMKAEEFDREWDKARYNPDTGKLLRKWITQALTEQRDIFVKELEEIQGDVRQIHDCDEGGCIELDSVTENIDRLISKLQEGKK